MSCVSTAVSAALNQQGLIACWNFGRRYTVFSYLENMGTSNAYCDLKAQGRNIITTAKPTL